MRNSKITQLLPKKPQSKSQLSKVLGKSSTNRILKLCHLLLQFLLPQMNLVSLLIFI